jgi:phosphate transport system substrate-binding protein
MKMRNRMVAVGLLLVVAAWAQAEALRIEGSTTVGPLADAFAQYFKSVQSDLNITVNQTGSGDGATALIEGRCDVADMSRFMTADEFKKAVEKGVMPVAHVVAMDGVCVVVHPSNPVEALTKAQIRDIYLGKITNWKDVGGPDMPIVAISRDSSSGTFETFESLVMEKQKMASGVEYVNSNPQAQARVKSTNGAIGYVGLAFLQGVKAVKVEKVAPTQQTIASGTYPLARPLFMFTNGYPKLGSTLYKFVTFHLTQKGEDIVKAKGFVPLTNY